MEVEIRIHRPLVLLLLIGGVVWGLGTLMQSSPVTAEVQPPVGGRGESALEEAQETEADIRELRAEQNVLLQREEILRAQLSALQAAQLDVGRDDPEVSLQIRETTLRLVALFEDRRASDAALLASLRELWEVQGRARSASFAAGRAPTRLLWPVPPTLGISAGFHDQGYRKRFGMEHDAIDIPVEQGSAVHAAADGVVRSVSDKGMGFNALVIEHEGGVSTLYGHVTQFLVSEGQRVEAGQEVALSGGRPGTPGAGMFTTGAHLHFEVHKDGAAVDPMTYLQGVELP